jgi:hypothetical protein
MSGAKLPPCRSTPMFGTARRHRQCDWCGRRAGESTHPRLWAQRCCARPWAGHEGCRMLSHPKWRWHRNVIVIVVAQTVKVVAVARGRFVWVCRSQVAVMRSRVHTGTSCVTRRWAGMRLNNSSPRPEAGWLAMPRPPCLLSGSLGPRHRPHWLAWQGQDLHDCPLRSVGFHVDPRLLSESPSVPEGTGALCAKHLA